MATEQRRQAACNQCSKPAIYLVGGVPLCLDCHYRVKLVQWMDFAQHAAMINHIDREITQTVGFPELSNPITIPPPPLPPFSFNNQQVTVNGGTVGAINLGTVHSIQVGLQTLLQSGEIPLADKLKELTDAVLNAADADEAVKNELLEQIEHLANEARSTPEQRKPGIIKATFSALQSGATTIASMAEAWKAVEPLIRAYFDLK